jgi:H+/Cl- antiporter ClcA
MFEMAKSSITLFFQGRLFRNPNEVMRQLAIGIGLTVLIFLLLAKFTGLLIAAVVAGFIGGALQPVLFKDLKYR